MILRPSLIAISLSVGMLGASAAVGQTEPRVIPYDGELFDENGPVNAAALSFIFEIDYSGDDLPDWAEAVALDVEDGLFSVLLGATEPLPDGIFSSDRVFLAVEIDGVALDGTQEIVTAPFAFAPSQLFMRTGDATLTLARNVAGNTTRLNISGGDGSSTDDGGGIVTFQNASGEKWRIGMRRDPSDGSFPFTFKTDDGGTTRMILTEDGRVGIGTVAPEGQLTIADPVQGHSIRVNPNGWCFAAAMLGPPTSRITIPSSGERMGGIRRSPSRRWESAFRSRSPRIGCTWAGPPGSTRACSSTISAMRRSSYGSRTWAT